MFDFTFCSPTKIIFGKDKEKNIGEIIKNYGFTKILLVYGGGSIKTNGIYKTVVDSLSLNGVSFIELSGVKPNPLISKVREGTNLAKQYKVEFILAVGGGSTIDTAKAIACGFYYDGDPFDFNLYKATPTKALPVGVILTISASGSELSNSCVISDDVSPIKNGFNSEIIRPLFVIENPELTFTVSKFQTAVGVVDIISHTLGRYFTKSNDLEFADGQALALIRSVVEAGSVAINNPNNYDARATLMIASSFSHNGYMHIGKTFYLPVHKLEHALSALYPNIAHGAGLAVLIPAWMEYVYKYDVKKFSQFSTVIFDNNYQDIEKNAIIGISSLKKYFKSLGLVTSLKELGLTKEDLPVLANIVTNNGTRAVGHNVKPLELEDVKAIFALAF